MSKNLRDLQNQYHVDKKSIERQPAHSKDLEAYAAPLTHDRCFEIVNHIASQHAKGKSMQVLILGAGSGYFDKRLLDDGFKNIDAIEYIPEYYKVRGTRLYSYDLNLPWSGKLLSQNGNRKYDLIIAIEVIEHLENQFLLMREIKNILSYKGSILITSPNVSSSFSRWRYLLTGYLEYFGPVELDGTGHIHPLFPHIFKLNLSMNNFKIIHTHQNRNVWSARIKESKIIKKIFIILLFIISKITIYKKFKEGEINIYEIYS